MVFMFQDILQNQEAQRLESSKMNLDYICILISSLSRLYCLQSATYRFVGIVVILGDVFYFYGFDLVILGERVSWSLNGPP